MSNLSAGRPRIEVNINDQTQLLAPNNLGFGFLQVRAERGEPSKVRRISTEREYIRHFGTYSPDGTPDSKYTILMLRAGAKFFVSRVAHYTDITDADTAEGTVADATLTDTGDSVVWLAKAAGAGYNEISVTTQAPASTLANVVDVVIELPDIDITEIIRDVPVVPTTQQKADFNAKSEFIDMGNITVKIPLGTVQLGVGVGNTVGAEVKANITSTDYVGDSNAKTGLHAFDSNSEAFRLISIRPVPAINQGIQTYIESRGKMKFDLGAPLGITPAAYIEYRNGTGAYDPPAFQANSYRGSMVFGELPVPDPEDVDITITVPAIVAVAANKLIKDGSDTPWASTAQFDFGRITMPNNGVSVDLNNEPTTYDTLSITGGNIITQRNNFGAFYYGDDSLLLDKTSALKSEAVADLITYIERELPLLVEREQFKPNAPSFWRAVYYRVRPFIESLVSGEAIEGGEGTNWFWLGDQDANSINDLQFNTANDIQSGIYKARFVFQPIVPAAKIALDIVPSTRNTIINVVNNFSLV